MIVSFFITVVYLFFLYLAKNKSLNDLLLILVTSIFTVSIFFPVLSYFEDPITWRNLSGLSIEKIEYVQMQYLSFLLGAVCFYLTWGWKLDNVTSLKIKIINQQRGLVIDKSSYLAIALIILGSVLYLSYIQSVGIDTLIYSDEMTDKYKASANKGFLYIGLNFLIWGILIGETVQNKLFLKVIFRGLAVSVVVWALFYIHTRTYVAILIFGYFYIYVEQHDIKVSDLKIRYISLLLIGWISAEAFGVARSFIILNNYVDFLELLDFAVTNIELGVVSGGSDLSHPFITFFEITRDEQPGWMMGEGFINGLISLIPSFILDTKPQTMAQWFAEKYYPIFSIQGGGTASSMVAEVWLNFGSYIAPFIVGFLISLFLFWVQFKAKTKSAGTIALTVPYFTFSLFFLERVGLVASMKHLIYMLIPFFLIVITFKALSFITR